MAARINTRFVLVLVITLGVGVAVIGGLYFVTVTRDTQRFIENGDRALAEKNFELAYEWYGKAVSKKPSVVEYLEKAEGALRQITPKTAIAAEERYNWLVAILERKSTVRASEPALHMPYLTELWNRSRLMQGPKDWVTLAQAGQAMYQRVAADNPQRNVGLMFKALANMQRTESAEKELDEAESDMMTALKGLPAGDPYLDPGYAALIIHQQLRADRLNTAGQGSRAEEKRKQAAESLKLGLEAAPNGVNVAKAALLEYVARDRGSAPLDVGDQEFIGRMTRAAELAAASSEPIAMAEVATVISNLDRTLGASKAAELLEDYLEKNPDGIYYHSLLSQIQLGSGKYDEARASAQKVIDSQPLPVGLPAVMQHDLKIQASGMMVNIAFNRWDSADPAAKPSLVADIQTAYDALAKFVADPATNLWSLQAAGKLEVAKGRYAAAASKFEEMIKRSSRVEAETYFLSAICLDQLGDLGLALVRMEKAIEVQPGNINLLAIRADYLRRLGRFDESKALADGILSISPGHPVASMVKSILETGAASRPTDAIVEVIEDARQLVNEGQHDSARQMLEVEIVEHPDDVRLARALVSILITQDHRDEARTLLDASMKKFPGDGVLPVLKASLDTTDPVQRLVNLVEQTITDKGEQLATAYSQLQVLARRSDASAQSSEAKGDADAAAKSRDVAERARTRATEFLTTAQTTAPRHPILVEQLFNEAVTASNWTEAERLAQVAREDNIDQMQGLLYKGRLEIARRNYAAAITALNEAVSANSYSSVVYRLLGIAHQQAGNTEQAIVAFSQAYERRPTDLMNVALYSELLAQAGQKVTAMQIVRKAKAIAPDNPALTERLLQLEAEVGDKRLAFTERRAIYTKDPTNRANAVQYADMLARNWPQREDVLDASGKERFAAPAWNNMPVAQREKELATVKTAWLSESDRILNQLVAADPKDLELAVLRARLLTDRGAADQGERVLREFIDKTPEAERTWEAWASLGDHLLRTGRSEEAEAAFAKATALQKAGTHDAGIAIASLYFGRMQHEKALSYLEPALAASPTRPLLLQAAEAHAFLRQFDKARQRLDEAKKLSEGAADVSAELLTAMIAEGEGNDLWEKGQKDAANAKYDEQRQAIDRAKAAAPTNPLPWLADGNRLLNEYRRNPQPLTLDDAQRAADQALTKRADLPQAVALKVNVFRARGNLEGAINEMEGFVRAHPDHASARRDLIALLVQVRNVGRAVEVAREGIAGNPFDAEWRTATAQLLARSGRLEEAIVEFKRADELKPDGGTLASLVEAYLSSRPPRFNEARSLLEKRPEQVSKAPYLQAAFAASLAGTGARDLAIAQLKKAFPGTRTPERPASRPILVSSWLRFALMVYGPDKLADVEKLLNEVSGGKPDSWELLALAGMWTGAGPEGLVKAASLLDQALAAAPAEETDLRSRLRFERGNLHVSSGEYEDAAKCYEECIKLNDRHSGALNNLAYMCVQENMLNDPARGLAAAERAAELDPNSPEIRHTLGKIYLRLGRFQEAEDELRLAIKLDPKAVESYIDLAEVLIKTDRGASARGYLGQARQLNPSAEQLKRIESHEKSIR